MSFVELEHKTWAMKYCSSKVGNHKFFQLSELEDLRKDTYDIWIIYKSHMEAYYHKHITHKSFYINQKV